MSTSAGIFGRPKCGVWKYFKFDEQAGKSICIVKLKSQGQDDEDALCNKSFKGKFTTNLKLHLRKEHSEEYRLLDVEEKKKREETVKRLGKNKVKSKCGSSSSLF